MAENKTIIAFDLYGTLLSTGSIAKQLGELVGSEQKASEIAATWRRYQLEYTFRLNSMGQFDDFFNVTKNSLLHALAENNIKLRDEDINGLMEAYDSLSTFPDVTPALNRLATNPDITAVVFSNGTKSMVSNSVFHSKDLSPHTGVFRDLVTVDSVKKYKPAPDVYLHLAEKMGKQKSQMGDMWLVSGNPFDIVGARRMGMKAGWVDRVGHGWQDAVIPELRPTVIGAGLDEIVNAIIEQQRSS
ncbi:hypothetical protein VTN77DRAFT_9601 [Rasamsonia byssochlamydoides]|uniref:uncharacterized protein n=1 Tax=Rasamsonia byssochlamydoides TaxID=89139 RepID=UPI003743285F